MGRPKLSDLSCSICDVSFKKKSTFEEHMENHLDIKIEPNEKNIEDADYVENKATARKSILKVKTPKIKCPICGMKCKGDRGLKIHMCAHKKNSRKNSMDASHSEDDNDEDNQFDKSPVYDKTSSSPGHYTNSSLLLSKNNVVNLSQNTQPSYILSVPQLQNQSLNNIVSMGNSANNVFKPGNQVSNVLNTSNQSNAPLTRVIPKQILQSLGDIPKFDCNSQKYMKWLKKFISNCKLQKYPLSPETYEKISYISGEITSALFDPTGSLKQKSVHFYVLNMHNLLAEIMMNHMERSFNSILK